MFIQGALLILLGVVGILVAAVLGVVSYLALKLFKKELNLKITIDTPKPKEKPEK